MCLNCILDVLVCELFVECVCPRAVAILLLNIRCLFFVGLVLPDPCMVFHVTFVCTSIVYIESEVRCVLFYELFQSLFMEDWGRVYFRCA